MSEVLEQEAKAGAGHAQKYTRNNPYHSNVNVNVQITAEGSEKETRHIELALEEGMTYTPGDAVGIIPENRPQAVEDVLKGLGYTGTERVLDHYKVEISLEEALRTRLTTGKLSRGAITQLAKLAPEHEGLKGLTGPDNRAKAE
ncbi:MAG TPA: oxidoreductase, partial [Edaphobacter sp.]